MQHVREATGRSPVELREAVVAARRAAPAVPVARHVGARAKREREQGDVAHAAHAQRVPEKDVIEEPHLHVARVLRLQEEPALPRLRQRQRPGRVAAPVEPRVERAPHGLPDGVRVAVPTRERRRQEQQGAGGKGEGPAAARRVGDVAAA
eukprot:6610499-Prymnesium_polylepis.1